MRLLNHPVIFALSLLALLTVALALGLRLSGNVPPEDNRREQVTASRDALGVLLSLLLGFTLAMALPRYDSRQQLVLDEANAIGTVELRSRTLPDPYPENVRALLFQYAKARLAFSRASVGSQALRSSESQTKELQSELWTQAQAAALARPTPVTALFISGLNDLIDLSEKRMAALENRIPPTVWIMLAAIGSLTCFMFGFACRGRFLFISLITPLMIAIVMGLIADLDSPTNGFIRINLSSLERAEQDLSAHAPSAIVTPLPALGLDANERGEMLDQAIAYSRGIGFVPP